MTVAEKNFGELSKLYQELIKNVLLLHKVREVKCVNDKEHFFDRIVVHKDDTISIFKYGLKEPFKELNFDHTVDYATCLAYIEHDLYLAERQGKPERGMEITFQSGWRWTNLGIKKNFAQITEY